MNQLVTMVMVLFIGVIGIGIVLSIGNPVIKSTIAGGGIDEAKDIFNMIDNAIMQVSEEGTGSSRIVSFYTNNDGFESFPDEDAFQFDILGNFVDYGSRSRYGNVMVFAGDEADCSVNASDIIMENNKILVKLDNSGNILLIRNKIANEDVPILDNTVYVSGRALVANSAELIAQGKSLPLCKTIVNAGSYKIAYILYTGADFLVIDIVK